MHLSDEMLDHFLRHLEIGDDAVAQRANSLDVARGPAQHLLGLLADGEDLLLAAHVGDGDHTGLIQHDAATLHVDECIGRAEIDGHVGRHDAQQSREHSGCNLYGNLSRKAVGLASPMRADKCLEHGWCSQTQARCSSLLFRRVILSPNCSNPARYRAGRAERFWIELESMWAVVAGPGQPEG